MVPSGPTAGATLSAGRCEPHATVGGTAVGLGGQGNKDPPLGRSSKVPGQLVELPDGASGTSVEKVTMPELSPAVTFTNHAPATSLVQGLLRFSSITL